MLTYPNLRTHRTGLAGVTELVPGTAHRSDKSGLRTDIVWTPWTAMQSSPRVTSFEAAGRAVRSTVTRTVAAQLKDRTSFGLELSGGLDSSIVAAALANAGIRLPAVNFCTRLPDGDERDYARAVARHLGIALTEVAEDIDPIDLRPPQEPHGPNGLAAQMDPHPWLEAPPHARPGKLEHVKSIVRAHHYMEPEHPTGEAIIHPLINQPLMELCLSIPTWLWVHGGRNRSVARQAFADRLPATTINRRTKGRFESMCARAFEENRRQLADLLLGGELARRRLILRGSGAF